MRQNYPAQCAQCISIRHNYVAQSIHVHQYWAEFCSTECSSASVSGTIKPFHDLILAWQPGLASRPSCLCKSPYRTSRKYGRGYILHFCQAGGPSCFADYFGNACLQPGGCVSSVGLRDTVCKASLRFMPHSKSFAPVQWVTSLFLYFKANF